MTDNMLRRRNSWLVWVIRETLRDNHKKSPWRDVNTKKNVEEKYSGRFDPLNDSAIEEFNTQNQ